MKIGRGIERGGTAVWFASDDGSQFHTWDFESRKKGNPLDIKQILAPVQPTKIVAVGLNYRDHARELGLEVPLEPILFLKPSSSVIGPGDEICYPSQSTRLDYEAELAVVISRRCRNIKQEHAKDYILGYTCFNDVTARDLQIKDGQWTRAKSFDTFSPIGPWIATDIEDPHNLAVRAKLNSEVKQSSNTSNLIFNVYELVSFISAIMTLETGDVIATGTPSGIGSMETGDSIQVEIEGIGVLQNKVF